MPCRRCGKVTGAVVLIYGKDSTGALVPKAGQCRARCGGEAPARHGTCAKLTTATAIRPGKRPSCPMDIAPGDLTVRSGDGWFWQVECAPPEASGQQPERRKRTRTHRA